MTASRLMQLVSAFIFAGAVSTSGFAQVNSPDENPSLPPVQSQGETEFVTGGIGLDESQAMQKEGRSWPLTLELARAAPSGAKYISDAHITIKDASGNTVLDADAEGPYMLVKLSPGKYSIDAVYESIKIHRDLNLQKGQNQRITLLWPREKDAEQAL